MSDSPQGAAGLRAVVYPGHWSYFAAALYLASRASIFLVALAILAGFVFSPPLLVRLVLFGGVIPALVLLAVMRVFRCLLVPDGGGWSLHRTGGYRSDHGLRIEAAETEQLNPWRWPWPGPGLSLLVLRGNGLRQWLHVQLEAPSVLVRSLAARGAIAAATEAHPGLIYADARAATGRPRWYHLVFKYGIFPLVAVFLAFRLHQYIMYGGLLGQYHLQGLVPYLSTLAYYWAVVVVYHVLWASLLRGLAAGTCTLVARYAPASAGAARKWAERGVRLMYYGGVLALIAWRST